MKRLVILAAIVCSFCLASSAEAGPLRRLAGVLRGGKAAVGRVLPPYRGRAGDCAGGACRAR